MGDTKTSIRVGNGPEVPIDLSKGIDDPSNADAKEQMAGVVKDAIGEMHKPANHSRDRLVLFIERIERLEEEKKGLGQDISDVLTEAKGVGFDTKTIKRLIKLRKMPPHERQEAEALLSAYMNAIGMTPIEAAIALAA
jgi:uncharacterized protein (UPF0335 family)